MIHEWTRRADKLANKTEDNILQEGIEVHHMTGDKLVIGYTDHGEHRDITVEQAWHSSLEHFLCENENQGTCEVAHRARYFGGTVAQEASADPVNPLRRSSSVGPPLSERIITFEERNDRRRRSSSTRSVSPPSRTVSSFRSQRILRRA